MNPETLNESANKVIQEWIKWINKSPLILNLICKLGEIVTTEMEHIYTLSAEDVAARLLKAEEKSRQAEMVVAASKRYLEDKENGGHSEKFYLMHLRKVLKKYDEFKKEADDGTPTS